MTSPVFVSQTNLPVFANTTDMCAYSPDGLVAGMIAFTVSPFNIWMFVPALPAGGTGLAATGNTPGFWWDTIASVQNKTGWIPVSGAFVMGSGARNYEVDTSGGVASSTFPASPTLGDTYNFADAKSAFATNALTLTGAGGINIGSPYVAGVTGASVTLNLTGVYAFQYNGTIWQPS